VTDPALATLLEELARDNPGCAWSPPASAWRCPMTNPDTMHQHDLERLTPEARRALLRVAGVRGTDANWTAASAASGTTPWP